MRPYPFINIWFMAAFMTVAQLLELCSCDRPKIFPIWAFIEKENADLWSLVSDSQLWCIIESPTIGSSYF